MKKFLLVVLAATLLMSSVACAQTTTTTTTAATEAAATAAATTKTAETAATTQAAKQDITITYMVSQDWLQDAEIALGAKFTEETGIKVDHLQSLGLTNFVREPHITISV